MWKHALYRIGERVDEFSRLDALTGDGDHGTAIHQALAQTGYNKARAAKLLGIHRTLLYKKMKRYGIDLIPEQASDET